MDVSHPVMRYYLFHVLVEQLVGELLRIAAMSSVFLSLLTPLCLCLSLWARFGVFGFLPSG